MRGPVVEQERNSHLATVRTFSDGLLLGYDGEMNYQLRFRGGPLDGRQEPSRTGASYSMIIARQLVFSGRINMALYDYESVNESADVSTRLYQFRGTYPMSEAMNKLAENKTF